MAGPHTCHNIGRDSMNSSGTPKPTSAVFRAPSPTPTYALAPTPALASALGPPGRYTNKDLQRATKLALKLFVKGQKHS